MLALNWGERRLANVHKLLRLARGFEAQEGRDLRRFLDHVAHVEAALGGREADAPVADGELDAVRLMSIHAAKGLEFPVVCVADLGREPNLRVPDLLVDGASARVGLRLLNLAHPDPLPALDYEELREERRTAQEEEEDRVLYVACTRAEDRLLLSGTVSFERWPPRKPGVAPIAWLAPALVPDAPSLAASAERPNGALTVDRGDGLLVRCVFNASSTVQQAPAYRVPEAADETVPSSVVSPPNRQAPPSSPAPNVPAPGPVPGLPATSLPATSLPGRLAREGPPPPTPLADPNATMSYSSLAELERCGYRYYLERVLRLPERRPPARAGEDDGGLEARLRGTIVHVLLESIDFTRPKPPSVDDVGHVARTIGAHVGRQRASGDRGAHRRSARRRARAPAANGPSSPARAPVRVLARRHRAARDGLPRPDRRKARRRHPDRRLQERPALRRRGPRGARGARLWLPAAALRACRDRTRRARGRGRPLVPGASRAMGRPPGSSHTNDTNCANGCSRASPAHAPGGFAVTHTPHREICLTCPGRGGLCSWGETHTMRRSATLESGG